LATLKRMLPVSSALFLLGLAIILIPPTLHLTSTVQGSNGTISLIGNYYGWNYSQPSGANPPITVAEGDTVIIKLTSTDTTHQFALDVDRDGPMFIASCPSSDTCSAMFTPSTPTSISITVSFPPGTYKYFCTFHSTMVGDFVVQAPPTPDFSVTFSPNSLSIQQGSSGSSTLTVTSQNGFSGTISVSASVSPPGPSPTFSPTSFTLSSSGTTTSTLTVSAAGGLYSSVTNGNYLVNVTATSGSLSHSTTVQVTVGSSSSSPMGVLNIPLTVWVGVAVVIIAVVAVTIFLARRKTAK